MAVTRIGAGVGAMTAGTAATFNGPNITTSDANTVAVVGVDISVSTNDSNTTCAVTYGGVSMTQLSLTLVGTSTNRNAVGIYYLFNPGTGTKSVVATPGGTSTKSGLIAQAVAFSSVKAAGVGTAQTATTTTHAITSTTGDYALRMVGNANALTSPNQTSEYLNGQTVGGSGDYGCLQSATGAASVSFTISGTSAQTNSVGTSLAAVLAKAETLTDTFDTSIDSAKWQTTGNCSVVAGQLSATPAGVGSRIDTVAAYDLTESYVLLEMPNPAAAGFSGMFLCFNSRNNGASYAAIYRQPPNLIFEEIVSSTSSSTNTTYDSTAHRWLRIKVTGGNVLWDTSPDGLTWTNRRTKAIGLAYDVVFPQIYTDGASGTTTYDNVNNPPLVAGGRQLNQSLQRASIF